MDAQEVMHMTDYSKITALYSRLSVGDEDRDGGESNSIQNQKIFLENYARGQHLTNNQEAACLLRLRGAHRRAAFLFAPGACWQQRGGHVHDARHAALLHAGDV